MMLGCKWHFVFVVSRFDSISQVECGGGLVQGSGGWLFFEFCIDNYCDWAVVEKGDFHVGTEAACLDRFAKVGADLLNELFVKGDGDFGTGGFAVGGAVAFLCAGKECELADDKDISTNVLDGAVHNALVVAEDAEANDFSAEPFDVFVSIGFFDGYQDEQTVLDGSHGGSINGDVCLGYSLDDCSHGDILAGECALEKMRLSIVCGNPLS